MSQQVRQIPQQRLSLAPNVTLSLEVLRMPLLELGSFLEQQLEENPLLELDSYSQNATEPIESPDDWLRAGRTLREEAEPDDGEDSGQSFERYMANPQTLQESLQMQLGCQKLSPEQERLVELLLDRINEQGYLADPLETIASETGEDLKILEGVLQHLQKCDPPGVGARNLRECLMLQLEHQVQEESLAYRILRDHFELFIQGRLSILAKTLGIGLPSLKLALEQLKKLEPKPGRAFSGSLPTCIIPDLILHRREGVYDVELNDRGLPGVSINQSYYRMLRDPQTASDVREFLATKFRMAGWLIKAIDERQATILAIARCVISLQNEFLKNGLRALKPLTQAQVASLIGRHPSTVSRAISGKTIDTLHGIFRLEEFFASRVPQPTQGNTTQENRETSISDERIKAEIQRLTSEEDPMHPLSDNMLAQRLENQNISVARRTIAKYRSCLGILPAHLRRRRL
ncbi:MAG: RNA polymerase factor sigma-54 [Candidatus Omnitrophica bacterium]|nr:RNA polymerase factor sigma-54 [Candidatus Omnitrophota bacterium]